MTKEQTYYRPEWTCSKYNAVARVAIIYNLIEGMCYFLEEYSAAAVGEILSGLGIKIMAASKKQCPATTKKTGMKQTNKNSKQNGDTRKALIE
jgi:hypothetical protein